MSAHPPPGRGKIRWALGSRRYGSCPSSRTVSPSPACMGPRFAPLRRRSAGIPARRAPRTSITACRRWSGPPSGRPGAISPRPSHGPGRSASVAQPSGQSGRIAQINL